VVLDKIDRGCEWGAVVVDIERAHEDTDYEFIAFYVGSHQILDGGCYILLDGHHGLARRDLAYIYHGTVGWTDHSGLRWRGSRRIAEKPDITPEE
jgi:hypothetical protein